MIACIGSTVRHVLRAHCADASGVDIAATVTRSAAKGAGRNREDASSATLTPRALRASIAFPPVGQPRRSSRGAMGITRRGATTATLMAALVAAASFGTTQLA